MSDKYAARASIIDVTIAIFSHQDGKWTLSVICSSKTNTCTILNLLISLQLNLESCGTKRIDPNHGSNSSTDH